MGIIIGLLLSIICILSCIVGLLWLKNKRLIKLRDEYSRELVKELYARIGAEDALKATSERAKKVEYHLNETSYRLHNEIRRAEKAEAKFAKFDARNQNRLPNGRFAGLKEEQCAGV